MKKALIAAVALAGVAIAVAPAANASPETEFLYDLNQFGIHIYDTGAALRSGAEICYARDTTSEAQVVRNVYERTSYYDVPNLDVAMIWVAAAEVNLCPWHQ